MFNIPEASLTSDWSKNSVTSLLIDNVENNENNNRGQKYPLQGVTRFNQVVIKLQLISVNDFCDHEEEKKQHMQPVFYRIDALGITWNKKFMLISTVATDCRYRILLNLTCI